MTREQREVKRYEAWALDGAGRINGVFPLPDGTEAEAYVELETAGGLVVEIREHLEGYADPLVRRPVHDPKRRLQHSDYVNPQLGIKGRNSYEYDARGFLKARQDANTQGKVRFRFEVRCDEKGRIVEERQLDARGRPQARYRYEHDAHGRVVKEHVFDGAEGERPVGTRTLEYGAGGRLARRTWRDGSGKERSAFSYRYDEQGRRTEICIETGGRRELSARFEWDERGRRTSMEMVDERRAASLGKEVREGSGDGPKLTLWVPPADAMTPEEAALVAERRYAELSGIGAPQREAMAALAYSHLERGRPAEARRLYQSLALLEPENAVFMAGAATAAMAEEQPRAALNWFERALAHQPGHVPSLAGKAEAHLKLGEVDAAIGALKELFTRAGSPEDPAVVRGRAMLAALAARRYLTPALEPPGE